MQILNTELNIKQDKVYFFSCTCMIKNKNHKIQAIINGYDFAKENKPMDKLKHIIAMQYDTTPDELKNFDILNWNLL